MQLMRPGLVLLTAMLLAAAAPPLCAQESPIAQSTWLRRPQRVIPTAHLRVVTPRSLDPDAAKRLAAQAEALFAAMAEKAKYTKTDPLWVLFNNDSDRHNGFSTQVPFPLVQVDLKPAAPFSTIFEGGDHVRRTLIHEFAHHLSNDNDRGTASVFGRVEPFDPLSFGMFLLTTPGHTTMPRFWHEGFGQWAETAYAPADTAFPGRGGDSLTHAVWRLDAQAEAIPEVGHWRLGYHRWPFGNRVYLYGAAYFRYLINRYDLDPWELIAAQAQRGPYRFNPGIHAITGKHHSVLIEEARAALLAEQRQLLAELGAQPFSPLPRHSSMRYQAGPPAWIGDELAAASFFDQYGKRILASVDGSGEIVRERTATGVFLRGDHAGALILARLDGRDHSHPQILSPERKRVLNDLRLSMVDCERTEDGWALAGIALLDDGNQQLQIHRLDPDLRPTGVQPQIVALPGRSWSPDLIRTDDGLRLLWVQTTDSGSRLLSMPVTVEAQPAELWSVAARMSHPTWAPDGQSCYVCTDVSGVFNAYRLDPQGRPQPITHVPGAVIACVPAPSGAQLALQVLDREGWYISVVPTDSLPPVAELPQIETAWQTEPDRSHARLVLAEAEDDGAELQAQDYNSWANLRFRYWTPSLTLSSDGASGIGVAALFSDQLRINEIRLAAGVGAWEASFVGEARWTYTAWPIDLEVGAARVEQHYAERQQIVTFAEFDYTETVGGPYLGVGRRFDVPADLPTPELRLRLGWDHWSTAEDELPERLRPFLVTPLPFTGDEYYTDLRASLDDVIGYPDGFGISRGWAVTGRWRHSWNDLDRDLVSLAAQGWIPVWPRQDHVVLLGGDVGWSDGDEFLQSSFSVGDTKFRTTGPHRLGWSVGYRAPVWRPFQGLSTSPWEHRQIVVTGFGTGTLISSDEPGGDGDWYHTIGLKINDSWVFDGVRFAPGLVIEQQLDHEEDTLVYFTLDGG